jgi:phage FluMu gp28-like protein
LALAGGANQVRGKTASLIVEDEFAFQPEQSGVYQAVAPLIQKATRFIAVSTPNGRTNTFSDLYHGVSQSI